MRSWPRWSSTRYSITWSARTSTDCGTVSPSAFAVLRLMTNSNFVGCSMGRSAGLAPFQNLVYVVGGASVQGGPIRRINHKSSSFRMRSERVHCGYAVLGC
jgi:hypothetical protein